MPLSINYDLDFNQGLVIFTGETGAGKSIILDALEAVLGGRAETTTIRTGVERAQVEATFRITPEVQDAVHALLEAEDLLGDDPNFLYARPERFDMRGGTPEKKLTALMAELSPPPYSGKLALTWLIFMGSQSIFLCCMSAVTFICWIVLLMLVLRWKLTEWTMNNCARFKKNSGNCARANWMLRWPGWICSRSKSRKLMQQN